MRNNMIAAGAVGSLALAAGFEYLANIPRSMASNYYPMTVRIWLSSLLLVLYVAGNFAYLRFALRKPSVSTWAAILVLVLGAAGILYLPLWSLGLPGLSHLLSARWNPLTSAVSTGGLTSLLRLQFAVLLVLGLAVLSRNRHTAAPLPHSNAAQPLAGADPATSARYFERVFAGPLPIKNMGQAARGR